ncbi:MAG: hypothetical protein RSB41_01580 [Bacilli bacterium]
MDKYIIISNEYFEIYISDKLENYGKEILKYTTEKIKEYLIFFKEKNYKEIIKCSYFTNREDFINRIKKFSLKDAESLPTWVSGCFYGGEIQILVNEEDLSNTFFSLTHETFHILFSKFVFEKNNYGRIVWLDESLALNFDGGVMRLINDNKFIDLVKSIINIDNLPSMSKLPLKNNNLCTKKYSEYDLFRIVGRYLIETKSDEELFEYIHEEKRILKDGETILQTSLMYFKNKYNL